MKCDICSEEMQDQSFYNFRVIRCCSEQCHHIAISLYATLDQEIKAGHNPSENKYIATVKSVQDTVQPQGNLVILLRNK